MGHDHHYERTWGLRDDAVVAVADGGCTFELRVCVLQTNLPGCALLDPVVERITVKPSTLRLPLPALPASEAACGSSARIRVRLTKKGTRAGKLSLRLKAVARSAPRKDSDTLVLRCLPPAG